MDRVRIDKWLWAARCYKTRSKATKACKGGHVRVNDTDARPSHPVRIGDRVEVRYPGGVRRVLEIQALALRRGPARVARTLYEDHSPPPPPRDPGPAFRPRGLGRPTKRDRRRIRALFEDD